jgi:dolichyl-phosphate beta-glucosyltransferase
VIDGWEGPCFNAAPVSPSTISVVIPAYNEGEHLPLFVENLTRVFLPQPAPAVEFIVSDDGSAPEHSERQRVSVEAAQARLEAEGSPHRFVYLRAERNGGKGSAIRAGWSHANPEAPWLAFLDADGAVSAEEFHRLAVLASGSPEADVIVGSRVKMAGRRIERSLLRHLQGRIFATLTESRFQLGFYDTQCGVKLLRASLLRPLLGLLQENRWLLDVELLALMQRQGARALEVPIDWEDPGQSKVIPGLDAAKMFWGLLRLKQRLDRLP